MVSSPGAFACQEELVQNQRLLQPLTIFLAEVSFEQPCDQRFTARNSVFILILFSSNLPDSRRKCAHTTISFGIFVSWESTPPQIAVLLRRCRKITSFGSSYLCYGLMEEMPQINDKCVLQTTSEKPTVTHPPSSIEDIKSLLAAPGSSA